MNTTEAVPSATPVHPVENYLEAGHTVRSWLLTIDHKRIGLLYLFSIIVFFAIGAVAAGIMRLELLTPPG
ncbi:MAG: cytochrome c oxidase subunit, partial [Pedosphaera sp.]|nr:cytochrome c oxidase subunit [Pedosphaera sp.]